MKHLVYLLLAPMIFCAGCLTFFGITFNCDKPLKEPASIPPFPDMSTNFSAYRNFAISTDSNSFAEMIFATDMGSGGLKQTVGKVPYRAIAERGLHSLIEKHFRIPLANERPAAILETTPQFISVKRDGRIAHVVLSIAFKCTKQDEARTVLFSETFNVKRDGDWVKGYVPIAFYETLNDIWAAFLKKFRETVRPASLKDGPETGIEMPELRKLSFQSKKDASAIAVGSCIVACNGWEAFQAAAWAKQQIFAQCVEHLGIEKERVRIRYDNNETKFNDASKSWSFVFSTWARTRLVMQYDATTRKGRAIVDLGLFEGTTEEATKAAKETIMREMNLRAATYADDMPEAKADVQFGAIETDVEDNLVIVHFTLVY